jgi:hypothetical protein
MRHGLSAILAHGTFSDRDGACRSGRMVQGSALGKGGMYSTCGDYLIPALVGLPR